MHYIAQKDNELSVSGPLCAGTILGRIKTTKGIPLHSMTAYRLPEI